MRGRGVGRDGNGGSEVVVAGAEALVRQTRGVCNDVHSHCETALHATQARTVWSARNTAHVFVTPTGKRLSAAKALGHIGQKQGVLRDQGEEGARHVQAGGCDGPSTHHRLALGFGCGMRSGHNNDYVRVQTPSHARLRDKRSRNSAVDRLLCLG